MPTTRPSLVALAAALAAGCGAGGGSSAAPTFTGPPALVASRARVDLPDRFSELALRSTRNLGSGRVADRSGVESRPSLHPDNARVVFARERQADQAASKELFVSSVDGSTAELRLTLNSARDDHPVWSPDGSRVLFVSDRDGATKLWTCDDRGADPTAFLPVPTGFADGEPDWSRATGRVVFSRADASGHHTLWTADGGGFGEVQVTDGGATAGPGNGDRQPAFSPDGDRVVFVRRSSATQAALCVCDLASGAVTVRLTPEGEVAWPRFDPARARLWFGLSEPLPGRQTLRLAHAPLASGAPTLLWPDERWRFGGLDFLPDQPAPAAPGPATLLDVTRAQLTIALSSDAFGASSQLREDDGEEYFLRTIESAGRQIAGLSCRFSLPVDAPEDVYELRVRAQARVSRVDGAPVLRMSLRNLVDNRFDTVVERIPPGTEEQELSFRTSSLRHLTRDRDFQFTVIADLEPGDPAEFWIDLVEVVLVPVQ
ncbi:MAG: TolB family protein [Planctomycetota bacterium]